MRMLKKLNRRRWMRELPYRNIDVISSGEKLMMSDFISILCDGELSLLDVGKESAPKELLMEAWDKIYEEYVSCIDPDFISKIDEEIEVQRKRVLMALVRLNVQNLKIKYDESMIEFLRSQGFDYKYDFSNIESYERDLNRAYTSSKFWQIEIDEYEQGKSSLEGNSKSIKIDKAYFDSIIFDLSKYAKFEINVSEISCLSFARRYNDMIRYYKEISKKK